MRFEIIPSSKWTPDNGRGVCYLMADNWDDFGYKTLFYLTYFDDAGEKYDIGSVKIGQFGMESKQSRRILPPTFDRLDEQFFSLGQDSDYYKQIVSLDADTSNAILTALNDLAADSVLYQKALKENVTGVSLLRFVNMKTIEEQFRRILDGGVELTDYNFCYVGPSPQTEGAEPLRLEFEITPNSFPPTNVHALIGRNGVGKTFVLNAMTRSLVLTDTEENRDGLFSSMYAGMLELHESPFANILSITFSAFDDFEIVRQRRNATKGVRYTNVGLRKRIKNDRDEQVTITQVPEDLAQEFSKSAKYCALGGKADRWRKALKTLEADPLFAEAEVADLVDVDEASFGRVAGKLYRRLSSGHKIVLLTICKLIENVEEKTLVLLDEPEAHLHPPLLAAFLRALSDLLIDRNGVAIIATHSPVVLQEVPSSCVWKVVRHGLVAKASRPEIETFAENVGVLTREVFGYEVTRSGFHKMLADAVGESEQIMEVVDKFDNQVGSEGRALISSMIASKQTDESL